MTKTIEERLAAVEKTQDDVVHTIRTAAGQGQRIKAARSLTYKQKVDQLIDVLASISGHFAHLEPRED